MSTTASASPRQDDALTASPAPVFSPTDLRDIQGNILRGYRMPNARHIALRVTNGGPARAFIAALLPGNTESEIDITTADEWDEKPPYCLNIGLTAAGLRALGIPQSILSLFPASFVGGPASNASKLGDVNGSAPEHWEMGGPANRPVHILLSLFTDEARQPYMGHLTGYIENLIARGGLESVWHRDSNSFPHGKVHFGYRDGIAQPRIKGAPGKERPDMQPKSSAGEFLLGRNYVNQYDGNFIGAIPPELVDNATYGAFRVLKQDVEGFEKLIKLAGERFNMSPELIAAKMMGRWRNGVPLTLSPDMEDSPKCPVHSAHINDFDYAPTDNHPAYFDDSVGLRCPVGSHIRRMNPRSGLTMGKPHTRRLIRRGMPYGPEYHHGDDPTIDRGLVGYFICGDIEMQFEFLQTVWVNADYSTAGIGGTREPILGAQPHYGGQFVIRTSDSRDPIILADVPRLVETRGSVYCLIPGINGLRFIAGI